MFHRFLLGVPGALEHKPRPPTRELGPEAHFPGEVPSSRCKILSLLAEAPPRALLEPPSSSQDLPSMLRLLGCGTLGPAFSCTPRASASLARHWPYFLSTSQGVGPFPDQSAQAVVSLGGYRAPPLPAPPPALLPEGLTTYLWASHSFGSDSLAWSCPICTLHPNHADVQLWVPWLRHPFAWRTLGPGQSPSGSPSLFPSPHSLGLPVPFTSVHTTRHGCYHTASCLMEP